MRYKRILPVLAALLAVETQAEVDYDLGADLRIRQEFMENVPGFPNGGVLLPQARSGVINHMRFRPRVYGEVKLTTQDSGKFRLYTRLTDEFRWYINPSNNKYTFPDEVILDNLFLEGTGLFDKFLDFSVGRQDLYGLYGLDHVFVDGTPGDGSRTTYGDMVRMALHFTEESKLDLFGLYNCDDSPIRWGTDRGNHRSLTGLGGGADPEMDDWGFGGIWDSNFGKALPYQFFIVQKNTSSFHRNGVKHPKTQRETIGMKLVPQLTDEWSLQLEGMGQIGRNGEGDTLCGWSTYAGVNWKSATESSIKPFGKFGYHIMSGDEDAAEEDGGHRAWDPIWARGVNDSELFLYGTHYGAAWWSNMHYLKATLGLDFGRLHNLVGSIGPMFAAAKDGMGGGDGAYKGLLSQIRYSFPLWLANKEKGERFEVFGHILAECFAPGNYFESDRTAYFLRWQLEFRF